MIEDPSLWQLALLVAIGVAAGFLNVMAGGGGLLTMPVLVFMGIPGPVANGTNRISILAQNLVAAIAFFRRGYSDFRLSLSLTLCTLPGAILGAMAGTRLEGLWFNRALAIIMIAVMVLMFFHGGGKKKTSQKRQAQHEQGRPENDEQWNGQHRDMLHGDERHGSQHEQDRHGDGHLDSRHGINPTATGGTLSRQRLLWGHLLMAVTGFYGGFIQIGVGFIMMPILTRVMGFDLIRTNMYKVYIIGGYSVAALIVFASQVPILWLVGLALALGKAIGGWISASVQVQRGEGIIKLVLYSVLTVFVVRLLFFP